MTASWWPGGDLPAVLLVACSTWALVSGDAGVPPWSGPVPARDGSFLVQDEGRAFRDATVAAGLGDWSSRYGDPVDKTLILETMGPGVGLVDLDGDGALDVYVVTGPVALDGASEGGNALFRNDGAGSFSPAPVWGGHGVRGWSFGVSAADHDNDGFTDLYVTTFGDNHLLRNNGDGTFTDITTRAGVAHPGWSTGSAWGDLDGDGWLDLFVTNYVVYDPDRIPDPGSGPYCTWKRLPVPCGPRGMEGDGAALFGATGDGRFRRVQDEVVGASGFYGLGVVMGDVDGDGDLDVYVAADQTPNRLLLNDGGTLAEAGALSGAVFNEDGHAEAGMGTDLGDADGDGRLDLFVTNFADESNTLYRNLGEGLFVDATLAAGLALPSFRYLAWGTGFQDFDSDGDADLFVVNGHVYPQVDSFELVDAYPQPSQLFVNRSGAFRVRPPGDDDGLAVAAVSRGAAFGDVDDDGDVDVLVGNVDAPPQLLLNELQQGNRIRVRLVGQRGNRDAVGARLIVHPEDGDPGVFEVEAGHSYLSASGPEIHLGLGDAPRADLEIHWPAGGSESPSRLARVPAGARVLVYEDGRRVVVATDGSRE